MLKADISIFDEPRGYQKSIRGAQAEVYPTTPGDFWAELTNITFQRLWMHRSRESLPRIIHLGVDPGRISIGLHVNRSKPPILHNGTEVSADKIIFDGSELMHRRSHTSCQWVKLSLSREDFADTVNVIVGRELSPSRQARVLRPSSFGMSRLLQLQKKANEVAQNKRTKTIQPEVFRALEQALLHAMASCLSDSVDINVNKGAQRHSRVIAKLLNFLEQNNARPVYLAEMCAATGISERTLRYCCQEQLGISPSRYLWLRRMHLVHHALTVADPEVQTVTAVATAHGFWELGRFSAQYRSLFGELPLTSLKRPLRGKIKPTIYRLV